MPADRLTETLVIRNHHKKVLDSLGLVCMLVCMQIGLSDISVMRDYH